MSEREGSQRERGATRADRPALAPEGLSEERATVRSILARVVADPSVAFLPRDTPLLSGGLALDSVTVVRLLAEIRAVIGVDVADLDLDLDALATIGTLADFVAAHAGAG